MCECAYFGLPEVCTKQVDFLLHGDDVFVKNPTPQISLIGADAKILLPDQQEITSSHSTNISA